VETTDRGSRNQHPIGGNWRPDFGWFASSVSSSSNGCQPLWAGRARVTRGPDENTLEFGPGWDASRRWSLRFQLQTYAPPGSVVLGERTRQLLGDLADVILLGTPQLKGKALPVNVYELRSLRGEGLHEKPLTVELGQEVSAQ
jgi:hypothetical protein